MNIHAITIPYSTLLTISMKPHMTIMLRLSAMMWGNRYRGSRKK